MTTRKELVTQQIIDGIEIVKFDSKDEVYHSLVEMESYI